MLTIQRSSQVLSGLIDHAASNNNGMYSLFEQMDRLHKLLILWADQSNLIDKTAYLRLAVNDNERTNDSVMNGFITLCSWRLLLDDLTSKSIPNFLLPFNRATLFEFEFTGVWNKILSLQGTTPPGSDLLKRRIGRAQNWSKQYPTLKQWFDLFFAPPPAPTLSAVVLEKVSDWNDVDYTDILAFDE
jgi:hypothetical protein